MIELTVAQFESLSADLQSNVTSYWTGLTAAIGESSQLISNAAGATAAQYEAFGRKMAELAGDYGRGVIEPASGAATPAERAILQQMGSEIISTVEKLQAGSAEAYAKYGQNIAEATREASRGGLASAGGALVDVANLTDAVAQALQSGNWKAVGETAAGIGATAAFGATAAALFAAAAALGVVGTPVAVAVFLGAGIFAFMGDRLGPMIFDGWSQIADLVGSLFSSSQRWQPRRDPLTLDLDGDGIETVAVSSTNPILFDHDGDGLKNATGWTKPDDGLLVIDRNGNGAIDNGTELFGDSTNLYSGGKAADGFAALAQEDTNNDGKISSADANFAYLRVWRDLNQNGISESGELATLASLNIASIDIAKKNNSQPGRAATRSPTWAPTPTPTAAPAPTAKS